MSTTTRLNNGLTNQSTELASSTPAKSQSNNTNPNNTHTARPYHQWQGNNTICCKGRIIGGPQKQNFFYTLLLILLPSIFFIGFVSINYIKEYHKYYVLIIYLLLLLISLISFGLTAFTDPGIIPRGIIPNNIGYKGPIHLKQRMCISGKLIEIKWCGTCHVFRPPRSFHCYICNNCVERFDHHCPWIGNCIGIRNYAYFTIFVNSLQLLCFWALFHCIYILYLRTNEHKIHDKSDWKQFTYALKKEYMAFGTGIYVFIGMWFVIGLTWFHWFLVFVGKTTNEQLRNLHPAGSPFKRSFLGNIMDHCCKFPATSVNLHSVAPKTSYNELYVNKSKVILLNNDEVKQHHQQIHSMHINSNSPFKACLMNTYNIPCVNPSHNTVHGMDNNTLITKGITHNHNNNKHDIITNVNVSKYKNGKNKNGYNTYTSHATHIQMTHFNNNTKPKPHNKNGYLRAQKIQSQTQNIESDGKIEEEAEINQIIIHTYENEEKKQQIIISDMDMDMDTIQQKINTEQPDQNEENKYQHENENEENKYDHENGNGNVNGDNNSSDSNGKSKSRKDENIDHENSYISYDDDSENEREIENENNNQLQYSHSVTPDITLTPDPNQLQITSKNMTHQRTHSKSNASKVSVASESPGSDNW